MDIPATQIPPNATVTPAAVTTDQEQVLNRKLRSYQDEVWLSSWKRRTTGVVSGMALGILFGAPIGGLALLSSTLFTTATIGMLAPAILPVMGAFALFGFSLMMPALGDIGVTSGAVAHGLKEQDRRDMLQQNNIAQTAESPEPSFNIFKGSKPINWKVTLTALACGAALGAFFLATGAVGFLAGLQGLAAFKAIVAAGAFTGVMNSMLVTGSVLGFGLAAFDFANITKNTANLVGHVFSGKIFEKKSLSTAAQTSVTPAKEVAPVSNEIQLEELQRLNSALARENTAPSFAQRLQAPSPATIAVGR